MSPASDATSSYLRIFGAALATLLGLLALVNAAIDPYSLYDTPKIAGISDRKVPPGDHLYALKTLASRRSSATALVLGSSRAEIGLDPAHPAWQGERCYNLAIPGADMALVRRYFEQLHRQRLVRKAVLALEFSMFDGKGRGVDDSAWAVQPSGAQNPAFYGRLVSILFSSDALLASARTVARSVLGGAHFYRDDGLRLWDSKQQKLERTGGHRPHFVRLIEAMQADHRALAGNLRYPLALDDFRMLLRIAHADRVDLRIVLSPGCGGVAFVTVAACVQSSSRVLGTDQLEQAIEPGELLPGASRVTAVGCHVQRIRDTRHLLGCPFDARSLARIEIFRMLEQRRDQLGKRPCLGVDVSQRAALDVFGDGVARRHQRGPGAGQARRRQCGTPVASGVPLFRGAMRLVFLSGIGPDHKRVRQHEGGDEATDQQNRLRHLELLVEDGSLRFGDLPGRLEWSRRGSGRDS